MCKKKIFSANHVSKQIDRLHHHHQSLRRPPNITNRHRKRLRMRILISLLEIYDQITHYAQKIGVYLKLMPKADQKI